MAKVYLSPSDQRSNAYAYGNTTEDVQCGKIAEACKTALERSGVDVKVGQYDTMANRCVAVCSLFHVEAVEAEVCTLRGGCVIITHPFY